MVQDTRELNRNAILTALLRGRPSSRKRIARRAGISQATVTRAVDELIADGLLAEGEEIVVDKPGRRARLLDLVADRAYVVGVDFGAASTRMMLTDLLAVPQRATEVATPSELDAAALAEWLVERIRELGGNDWDRVTQVALGLPGAVSQAGFAVTNAPNLPQVMADGFLDRVRVGLDRPLGIDNDADYALLGEQRLGAAHGTANAAMLTLGTGLGAGLAIDGKLLQGRAGLIGEFGQLPVGPLGARLEELVTGPGIMAHAHASNAPIDSPADLFAPDAPPLVRSLRAQFDQALLIVLMAIVVACEPTTIVLGGRVAAALGDLQQYEESLRLALHYAPQLAPAALGAFSGATGAAVAALHAEYLAIGVESDALAVLPNWPVPTGADLWAAAR